VALGELNMEDLIEFKGTRRGLIVIVKKRASLETIKQSIMDRLESSIGFFNGAKICAIDCPDLSDIELIELKEHISSRFDVEFIEEEPKEPEGRYYNTKYINTLRSGDNVQFDGDVAVMTDMKPGCQIIATGNIVVMGNINPGAKVVAYGNVTVMGKVEGFIHAGASGNTHSYIVANNLDPKILKIANCIAEAPEEEYISTKAINPEIAFINNGIIVIENYSSKNIK
jgi:septum site-determining protein MinC